MSRHVLTQPLDPLAPTRGGTDQETTAALYEGLTLTQMARAFGMDSQDIQKKLIHVQPSGRKNGYLIYRIKDVAPHLVRPVGDITEHLKRMNPKDLPPMLSKEFWNGQNSRLKFEQEEGDLWPTDQVIEYVGEILKVVRMVALTTADSINSQVELTDKQREIVDSQMRSMLEKTRVSLENIFQELTEEEKQVRQDSLARAGRLDLTEDDDEDEL